jgi:hypothetical protein
MPRLDTTSKGWGLLLGHLRGLSHGHGHRVRSSSRALPGTRSTTSPTARSRRREVVVEPLTCPRSVVSSAEGLTWTMAASWRSAASVNRVQRSECAMVSWNHRIALDWRVLLLQ